MARRISKAAIREQLATVKQKLADLNVSKLGKQQLKELEQALEDFEYELGSILYYDEN